MQSIFYKTYFFLIQLLYTGLTINMMGMQTTASTKQIGWIVEYCPGYITSCKYTGSSFVGMRNINMLIKEMSTDGAFAEFELL